MLNKTAEANVQKMPYRSACTPSSSYRTTFNSKVSHRLTAKKMEGRWGWFNFAGLPHSLSISFIHPFINPHPAKMSMCPISRTHSSLEMGTFVWN
jgi:hypothetical protein